MSLPHGCMEACITPSHITSGLAPSQSHSVVPMCFLGVAPQSTLLPGLTSNQIGTRSIDGLLN